MVNNNKIILERQKMQNKMKLKYSFPFLASICGEEHKYYKLFSRAI